MSGPAMSAAWQARRLRAARGRDAVLPDWLRADGNGADRPRFDSIVVRGNGIGALVCAARLARSTPLSGRVVVAAPRPAESRRLINGCTLRARSLDYYALAAGCAPEDLVRDLYGGADAAPRTQAQRFAVFHRRDGRLVPCRAGTWMGAEGGSVLAYGVRNSYLAAVLARRADAAGVRWHDELPSSLDDCRSIAAGEAPLVINGSHRPLAGAPSAPRPRRFVAASQITLRRRDAGPLPPHTSMIAVTRHGWGFDTGVFYPFRDPLTPDADYYGIFYCIVGPGDAGRKEIELARLRDTLAQVSDAIGLDPVDTEETRGEAVVPCFPWSDVPSPLPGFLDLHRIYDACVPIITGDGMTRAGLAGWVAAESILAGENPTAVASRSLHLWRRANRGFAWMMTALAPLAEPLLRRYPAVVGRAADQPDTWAAVA